MADCHEQGARSPSQNDASHIDYVMLSTLSRLPPLPTRNRPSTTITSSTRHSVQMAGSRGRGLNLNAVAQIELVNSDASDHSVGDELIPVLQESSRD